MSADNSKPNSEREQTDESLRTEREKADDAIGAGPLANLLSNAIKFTPPHGHVSVRAEKVGDDIRFAVSDTGVGIPSERLEAVFERYVQIDKDDRRGVGLGLYISKCIVLGHGGVVWAESALGHGSTFRFTLPVHVPS